MEIPFSTEALTRLLRSKDITTSQIVEIVSHFNELDLYFPNKEIFIVELIQDRWNDQKLVNFKKDYQIWALYNRMFSKISDGTLRKKVLKDLRFVPHLMRTLDALDSLDLHIPEMLSELESTCILINTMIKMEVSAENAIKILAKTLNLIQKTDSDHKSLLVQIINLTDIPNVVQVSAKTSASYCEELLFPTIKYFVKFGTRLTLLSDFLSKFLFEGPVDSIQLLECFVREKRSQLESQDYIFIFENSIQSLSKLNFSKLEKIFTIIISCQKNLAPSLLRLLSISKKTMSQEFLEELLLEGLKNSKHESYRSLILHILDLDVEVGLQHFDELVDLVMERKDSNLWSKLVQCFVDAREILKLLDMLQEQCSDRHSYVFLLEPIFAGKISTNISKLSVAQLNFIVNKLIDQILARSSDTNETSCMILKLVLKGVLRLPYLLLPELKPAIGRIFTIDRPSKLWECWYFAMEIYDDIIPLNSLESIDEQLSSFFAIQRKSKELFYYFFKLREYVVFDLSTLSSVFLEFFLKSPIETKRTLLEDMFSNWYSLLNSCFPSKILEQLIDHLVSREHMDLLNRILEDDNIFEEQNIMFSLVQKLQKHLDEWESVSQLNRIPIQCINKNIRPDLINSLSSKEVILRSDIELIGHLLSNPTFKSNLETQINSSYLLLSRIAGNLNYENVAVERVWQNHLSRIKEGSSVEFIRKGIEFISKGLLEKSEGMTYFQMAFLAVKNCRSNMLDSLKKDFISQSLKVIENAKANDIAVVIWLLTALYYVFKLDKNFIPNDTSLQGTISAIRRFIAVTDGDLQKNLLESMFLFYCVTYHGKPEYLYAHYMVLRNSGIKSAKILPPIADILEELSKTNLMEFNRVFAKLIFSLGDHNSFTEGVLELYRVQIEQLERENTIGTHLFIKSLSEFYTNCEIFKDFKTSVLQLLTTLQSLLISKPWLFSQYCIEMIFPLSFKLMIIFLEGSDMNDDIFTSIIKLISNILLAHDVKLTNRHHLINSFLCMCLELIAEDKDTHLSSHSAKYLSRLITNFVEPNLNGSNYTNSKNTLSSELGLRKKLLRKYIPMLLVKYVHLSIYHPFESSCRKELASGVYAMFDLISQAELNMINGLLDHASRQYFKSLYSEYKKVGKWNEG